MSGSNVTRLWNLSAASQSREYLGKLRSPDGSAIQFAVVADEQGAERVIDFDDMADEEAIWLAQRFAMIIHPDRIVGG